MGLSSTSVWVDSSQFGSSPRAVLSVSNLGFKVSDVLWVYPRYRRCIKKKKQYHHSVNSHFLSTSRDTSLLSLRSSSCSHRRWRSIASGSTDRPDAVQPSLFKRRSSSFSTVASQRQLRIELGTMSSKESCRIELCTAIRQLSDRCLYSASKWAAEQLVGIEEDPAKYTPSNTRFQRGSSSIGRRFCTIEIASTPSAGVSYVSTPVMEEDDTVDGDFYLLAKSYFDCQEYRRAAHALRDQNRKKSVFLRCYALYLAGEKRKEEEIIELEGPLGKSDAVNRELVSLERELSMLHKNGTIDPFVLYLYGLVLKDKGNENLARMVLVESVNSYPWNWSAWSELQSLCTTIDILNSLSLNNHWMKDFFLASAYQELRMHSQSLTKYEYLQSTFGFSNYIQAQIAKARYSLREFEQVEALFEEL